MISLSCKVRSNLGICTGYDSYAPSMQHIKAKDTVSIPVSGVLVCFMVLGNSNVVMDECIEASGREVSGMGSYGTTYK